MCPIGKGKWASTVQNGIESWQTKPQTSLNTPSVWKLQFPEIKDMYTRGAKFDQSWGNLFIFR